MVTLDSTMSVIDISIHSYSSNGGEPIYFAHCPFFTPIIEFDGNLANIKGRLNGRTKTSNSINDKTREILINLINNIVGTEKFKLAEFVGANLLLCSCEFDQIFCKCR